LRAINDEISNIRKTLAVLKPRKAEFGPMKEDKAIAVR
jgi:hypothetical protein